MCSTKIHPVWLSALIYFSLSHSSPLVSSTTSDATSTSRPTTGFFISLHVGYTGQVYLSNQELAALTEDLFSLEGPNNAASLVTINTDKDKVNSSQLLIVSPAAYIKTTIAKLLPLHDNYFENVKDEEVATPEEITEEKDFLNAIVTTPVMKKTQEFLVHKGYISLNQTEDENQNADPDAGSANLTTTQLAFRNKLLEIWFGFYSRHRGHLGSSGFEHVFLGELKKGKVAGLHNWVFFSSEEAKELVRLNEHLTTLNLGSKGSIIKLRLNWRGKVKPLTSMFVGTSPELELALYTVCFYTRPQKHCPVVLDGRHFTIQTYVLTDEKGRRLVGSAYPEI